MHPFLAPEFPCAYLSPWQGDKISGIIIVGIVLLYFISRRQQGENIGKDLNWPLGEFAKQLFSINVFNL